VLSLNLVQTFSVTNMLNHLEFFYFFPLLRDAGEKGSETGRRLPFFMEGGINKRACNASQGWTTAVSRCLLGARCELFVWTQIK